LKGEEDPQTMEDCTLEKEEGDRSEVVMAGVEDHEK